LFVAIGKVMTGLLIFYFTIMKLIAFQVR